MSCRGAVANFAAAHLGPATVVAFCCCLQPLVSLPTPSRSQAQVQYVEGGSSAEQLTVSVRLPNGQVINLDGGSMAAGKTIDVEWREVDGK